MGVVYAIFDPRSAKLVYIGKAGSFARRVRNHLLRLRKNEHENRRLQSLHSFLARTNQPLVFREVLEADDSSVAEIEKKLIRLVRARGTDLFNVSSGGEGGAGPRSEETKARISAALKGVRKPPRTQDHIEKIRAKKTGVTYSEDVRKKKSTTMLVAATRGSRHYLSKITEHDVVSIRRLLAAGHTQTAVAGMFGISRSSVLQIHLGRAWKHVPSEAV